MDACSDFSVIRMTDGTLNAWGKNARGQLGTSQGIGLNTVESENVPTLVDLTDDYLNIDFKKCKNFAVGSFSMLIQDENNDLYKTGIRLWY